MLCVALAVGQHRASDMYNIWAGRWDDTFYVKLLHTDGNCSIHEIHEISDLFNLVQYLPRMAEIWNTVNKLEGEFHGIIDDVLEYWNIVKTT